MNRTILPALTALLAITWIGRAYGGRADNDFPISFWGAFARRDAWRMQKAVVRRHQGDDMTFRKQWEGLSDSDFREYLDFDHSMGYRSLVAPWAIEEMWIWGHSHLAGNYFRKVPADSVGEAAFRDTVAARVKGVVTGLADHPAVVGWALWGEPDLHHYKYRVEATPHPDTVDDFYYSLFRYDDIVGEPLDSASVFSLIVQELHEQDSISGGLIFDSVGGRKPPERVYWWRSVSELKSRDGSPNSIDCMGSAAPYAVMLHHRAGDPRRFAGRLAALYDSIACADTLGDDGWIHFWPFLQACGWCGFEGETPRQWYRMLTAEELRLMTSIALEHQAKGLLYWRLTPWDLKRASDTNHYAGLWDENSVPFDVPFEYYAYERNHDHYLDPDVLRPFENGFDPFCPTLGPRPDRLTEEYFLWKYGPYARRFNALRDITSSVQRIRHWLLGLWKADRQDVRVSASEVEEDSLTDSPSIMAMTRDTDRADEAGSAWIFCVNHDFHPDYSPLACSVEAGIYWPHESDPANITVVDYSNRHLRKVQVDSTAGSGRSGRIWISFETRLETGAGELLRVLATDALPPRDFVVTEPDLCFLHPSETIVRETTISWLGPFPGDRDFVVGDTVRFAALVYNLGFTGADSVRVLFYDGDPRGTGVEIGRDYLSLDALGGTEPEVDTATTDWPLSDGSDGVHDIHVVVNHEYRYTPQGRSARHFLSEADSGNNHTHLPLYVFPLDYATEERGDPWDMEERTGSPWGTPDIVRVWNGVVDPDSISSVCELRIRSGEPPGEDEDSLQIFLHVGSTDDCIDPDAYGCFRARLYVDDPCSLQVFWHDACDEEERPPTLPPLVDLEGGTWNTVAQRLEGSSWGDAVSVDRFGFLIHGKENDGIRVSWVKLTRE